MDISFYEFSERLKKADREDRLQKICEKTGVSLKMKFSPMQLFPPNTGQDALHEFFAALGYEIPPDEEIELTTSKNVATEC